MRIGDWSSDVCSSDLSAIGRKRADRERTQPYVLTGRQPFGRIRNRHLDHLIAVEKSRLDLRHRPCAKNMLDPRSQSRFIVLRQRSEEHTSELQSHMRISYAVFCLKTNISNPENNTH